MPNEQVYTPLNFAIGENTHLARVQPNACLFIGPDVEATVDPDRRWFDLPPESLETFLATAKQSDDDFQSGVVIGSSC